MQQFKDMFRVLGEVLGRNSRLRVTLAVGALAICAVIAIGVGTSAALGPAEPTGEQQSQGHGGDEQRGPEQPKQEGSSRFEQHDYSGQERAVVDMLKSASWEGKDGEVVTFTEDHASVNKKGSKTDVGFVVKNASSSSKPVEVTENDTTQTYTQNTATFVLVWGGEPYSATLTGNVFETGASYVLEFEPLGTLSGTTASSQLELESEPAGLDEAVLGNQDALLEALRTWCTDNAPSATRAKWDGSATHDWASGLVSVQLTLNDQSSKKVTCVLDVAQKSFQIRA